MKISRIFTSSGKSAQPFTLSMCLMREAKKAGISWWTSCATNAGVEARTMWRNLSGGSCRIAK